MIASLIHLPPRRLSSRFNALLIATLTIIAASLLVFSLPASASGIDESNLRCVEIKEDYDLRNLARDHNVFLVVHEAGEDNSIARRHICSKLEATPTERLIDALDKGKGGRSTIFAYLEISESSYDANGDLQDGGKNFARASLGAKNFPSFLFISGGMDRSSKYSNHITYYTGSKSDDSDTNDLSNVEKFIYKHTGFYVGI